MDVSKETQFSRGHISWPVRFAYAGGDVACNIVFGMIGTLLTFFYTEYAFISAGTIGLIMLVSRVFDGFSDIIMGVIVDKTHSRFGKARPWLLWMSLPFCVSAVLLFTVPNPEVTGDPWYKIIYIFITYNFCTTICYTAINLPYGTLSTLMTDQSHERDMLGNIRMGLSPLGKIIAGTATLPLVYLMGDNPAAWAKTMSIWAAIAFVLIIINFIFCKETVTPPKVKKEEKVSAKEYGGKKLPMKTALKFLVKNQYFWMVLLLWMFQSVSFGVVGTTLPYFCKYIMKDENLYSTLFLVETLTLVIGVFICMPLVKKVGKRNLALIGGFIALSGQLIYLVNPTNIGMVYMSCVLRSVGLAPLNAVVFGMLGDVVDFGHWKFGFRQESFICAGGSVGTKLGSGLASVLITQLLQVAGFISGQTVQSESALNMIKNLYIIGPIIIAAGVILVLIFYNLDKKFDKVINELFDRLMIEKTEEKLKEEREAKKASGKYNEDEESKIKPIVESKPIVETKVSEEMIKTDSKIEVKQKEDIKHKESSTNKIVKKDVKSIKPVDKKQNKDIKSKKSSTTKTNKNVIAKKEDKNKKVKKPVNKKQGKKKGK